MNSIRILAILQAVVIVWSSVVVAAPPVMQLPASAEVLQGHKLNFALNATDADGDGVFVSVPNKPDWLTLQRDESQYSSLVETLNLPGQVFTYISALETDAQDNLYLSGLSADGSSTKILRLDRQGKLTDYNNPLRNAFIAVSSGGTVYAAAVEGGFTTPDFSSTIYRLTNNGILEKITDEFSRILSMKVDAEGQLVVYTSNGKGTLNRIYRVDPISKQSTLLAGSNEALPVNEIRDIKVVDGKGTAAVLGFSTVMTVDSNNEVLTLDTNSNLRRITHDGTVTTIKNHGLPVFVRGLVVDENGNLYCAEQFSLCKKAPDKTTSSFLAGNPSQQAPMLDGLGYLARFNNVIHIARDRSGIIYLADIDSSVIPMVTRIRKVSFNVTALTGTPAVTDAGIANVMIKATDLTNTVTYNIPLLVRPVRELGKQVVTDLPLRAYDRIIGGVMQGQVSGIEGKEARLSTTIAPAAHLSNVVLATGSSVAALAVLGPNVVFESAALIPPGIDLGGASKWLTPYSDSDGLARLALATRLVVPGDSLLAQLVQVYPAFANGGVSPWGNLFLVTDKQLYTLAPIRIQQAAVNTLPGLRFNADSSFTFVTLLGHAITVMPTVEDFLAFDAALKSISKVLADMNGNLHVEKAGGRIEILRPNVVSDVVPDSMPTGLQEAPHDKLMGLSIKSFVYHFGFKTYRQRLAGAAYDTDFVQTELAKLEGIAVSLDAAGYLHVSGNNFSQTLWFDYLVVPSGYLSPGIKTTTDRNGDGVADYLIVYPDKREQVLYRVP